MSNEVFANGMEISCKSGDAKVIAAFPDVCLTPPSPPAGPIPVPYPNTSFSKDMKDGSKNVKIDGKEVMLKDKSFLKTSPLGNEAATKSLGAGVVSHVITGKTYYIAWSMDVSFEGMNVDRHVDFTNTNHASPMTNGGTTIGAESAGGTEILEECPCCHQKPPHANQVDPDTSKMYENIKESDFYQEGRAARLKETSDETVAATKVNNPTFSAELLKSIELGDIEKLKKSEEAFETLEDARKEGDCPNLHKSDTGCGQYFNKTNPDPPTSSAKERKALGFTDGVREEVFHKYPNNADGKPLTRSDKKEGIAHMTPLMAGGCPTSMDNLIPFATLEEKCKKVDVAQGRLQVDTDFAKARARK